MFEHPLKAAYIGKPEWTPGANTLGYYTFDDQNASQITDFSGKGNNLTGGTMPSYTLVSGTNYAGNYANSSSGGGQSKTFGSTSINFTQIIWLKVTQTGQRYVSNLDVGGQYAIIYGYNSGQIELYTYVGSTTKRSTIKSNTQLNTWYMVATTFSSGTSKTYLDGELIGTMTSSNTSLSGITLGASGSADRIKGQIGECVIENKTRTADEIADYYDQTKGNYGIS